MSMVTVVLVFDEGVPSNAVHLETSADEIRVTLSRDIDIPTVVALHPEIRSAVTQAMRDNAHANEPAPHEFAGAG